MVDLRKFFNHFGLPQISGGDSVLRGKPWLVDEERQLRCLVKEGKKRRNFKNYGKKSCFCKG
jgi:hypothetical protein